MRSYCPPEIRVFAVLHRSGRRSGPVAQHQETHGSSVSPNSSCFQTEPISPHSSLNHTDILQTTAGGHLRNIILTGDDETLTVIRGDASASNGAVMGGLWASCFAARTC